MGVGDVKRRVEGFLITNCSTINLPCLSQSLTLPLEFRYNGNTDQMTYGGTMSANQTLLTDDTRAAIEKIAAARQDIEGQRASALLALADGRSRVEAAAAVGLTEGQVNYIVRKFSDQGLGAFPSAGQWMKDGTSGAPEYGAAGAATEDAEQLRAMVDDLNARVAELQQLVDEKPRAYDAHYSPARLLAMVRDNIQRLTPEMQMDVLRNLQGMSAEDLLDLETWKGLAYMMTYSAKFQAEQMREKVSDTINQVVPEPIQPGRLWRLGKSGLDRVTPEFAKQILSTFQGATREDLLDPNTWKGVWYMITYSIQFQAEQWKQRLSATEDSQSPE